MKLSDAHWEPETALCRLGLEGQDLASHQAFWDRSAEVDAIRSIADPGDDESFESSGIVVAESMRPLLSPDSVLLEIGCGIGRVLQHVAPMCREVHGVDISAEMVELLRAKPGGAGRRSGDREPAARLPPHGRAAGREPRGGRR